MSSQLSIFAKQVFIPLAEDRKRLVLGMDACRYPLKTPERLQPESTKYLFQARDQ
jgi:hypothetical protein